MQTIIPGRLRAFIFLALFLGLLRPQAMMAQNNFGEAVADGFFTAQDFSDSSDFGFAGEAGEAYDAISTFWDFAQTVPGDLEALQSISSSLQFQAFEVNGFQIVAAVTNGEEALTIVNFINNNADTNNVAASIPDLVSGIQAQPLPVVAIYGIGSSAHISSLSIGIEVTAIAAHALDITALTNITAASSHFYSIDGVLFNGDQTVLIRYPEGLGGNYVVPASVTNIADDAFYNCTKLSSLVIGSNVVQIGADAFENSGLQNVYFGGNAPLNNGTKRGQS
jgi:hypothetical protein